MLPLLLFPATLCPALFAGAGFYINVAEHPAAMRGDMRAALAQWAVSYKPRRAAQLAVVGLVASPLPGYRERARLFAFWRSRAIYPHRHHAYQPQASRD